MGILDAFKNGGFFGVGESIGDKYTAGTNSTNSNGQNTGLTGFDKFLIAGVVTIFGAIVISKVMK